MSEQAQTQLIDELLSEPAPASVAKSMRLGETLIRLGRLNAEAVAHIEREKSDAPFGKTAVKLGYIKPADLEYALGVHFGFLHETSQRIKIPKSLVVARNPHSQEADEFRSLRTRLVTSAKNDLLRSLVITGADEQCDAAYVATNLAASFAQLGRTTLVVDANFRKPSLAGLFGDPRAQGITDTAVFAELCSDVRIGTMVRNLDLLPAGSPSPDTHKVLSDSKFKEAMRNLALDYDVVIILSAPYTHSADCELIWSSSRGALIVVKKDESRLTNLEKIRRGLRQTETSLAGAVLSR